MADAVASRNRSRLLRCGPPMYADVVDVARATYAQRSIPSGACGVGTFVDLSLLSLFTGTAWPRSAVC